MKVRLNLSTSPLESNRRFALGATVVGTIAVIALLALSFSTLSVWRRDKVMTARQDSLESQIARLQQQRQSLSDFFENSQTVQRRQRAAYLNSLIQQRAFPWIKIFMDLERILPEGVRVVSIEPKMSGDTVQLTVLVGAMSDDSKLKFLKALETSPAFSHIELLNETRPTNERPGAEQSDRVMLSLQAQYSVI
jgi:type IV pilus assembly protein PilN